MGCPVQIDQLVVGPIDNNVYIIGGQAGWILVDPGAESARIMEALDGRVPDYIVLTHWHWDHVGAAYEVAQRTGAPVVASATDAPFICGDAQPLHTRPFTRCPVDKRVADGDTLKVGDVTWEVIATPGHTAGSICLFARDALEAQGPQGALNHMLIAGDTLFAGTVGRTDFEDSSPAAMGESVARLALLPDETLVLPGHNDLTTIGLERQTTFRRFGVA